jgi:hypothetical protein
MGLAKLQVCERFTLTRLTDSTGTTALLFDSPEPLSYLHDVTPTLLHKVWRRLPHPVPLGPQNPVSTALSQLEFVGQTLVAPAAAAHVLLSARVQVLLVTSAAPAFSMQVYDVPAQTSTGVVPLHRVAVLDATAAQAAGLGALVHQPLGVLIAVHADHTVAGTAQVLTQVEVPVPLTLLGNADESSTVMLMAAPLASDSYTLNLAFSRTRWETTTSDPASVYQDSATIPLVW